MPKNSKNRIEILNSNEALEGRQQITFRGKKGGIYPIVIAQRSTEFAPYLNYSDEYKNTYIANSFSVMISEVGDILSNIETIKNADIAPTQAPAQKSVQKSAQKSATPTATKIQGKDGVWLDIEE